MIGGRGWGEKQNCASVRVENSSHRRERKGGSIFISQGGGGGVKKGTHSTRWQESARKTQCTSQEGTVQFRKKETKTTFFPFTKLRNKKLLKGQCFQKRVSGGARESRIIWSRRHLGRENRFPFLRCLKKGGRGTCRGGEQKLITTRLLIVGGRFKKGGTRRGYPPENKVKAFRVAERSLFKKKKQRLHFSGGS